MKSVIRFILIAGFLGVLSIGFTGSAAAFFGKNQFELEVEKEQGAVKLFREAQRGGYDLITTDELKKWIDEERGMVIVDTMPYEDSYKKNHIPGAVQFLFPIPEMDKWDEKETANKSQADFEALLGDDKEITVIIYCGFVKCTRSHNGALWAKKLGYTNVYRYPGGIYAWKGADNQVEKVE